MVGAKERLSGLVDFVASVGGVPGAEMKAARKALRTGMGIDEALSSMLGFYGRIHCTEGCECGWGPALAKARGEAKS